MIRDLRPEGQVIILARPLSELWAHVQDHELPSWSLVARSVKVVALALFRWHFCDHILFPSGIYFCHNLESKISITEKITFKNEHPYMIETAIFLRFKPEGPSLTDEIKAYSFEKEHTKLTAKELVEHYRDNEGITITNKQNPTIWNLLSSKVFVKTDYYHDVVFLREPIRKHNY